MYEQTLMHTKKRMDLLASLTSLREKASDAIEIGSQSQRSKRGREGAQENPNDQDAPCKERDRNISVLDVDFHHGCLGVVLPLLDEQGAAGLSSRSGLHRGFAVRVDHDTPGSPVLTNDGEAGNKTRAALIETFDGFRCKTEGCVQAIFKVLPKTFAEVDVIRMSRRYVSSACGHQGQNFA